MKNFYPLKSSVIAYILICTLLVPFIGNAQTVTDPSVENPNYDALKAANVNPNAMTPGTIKQIQENTLKTTQGCLIPVDGTFNAVPRNDDGSFGPITLPFDFQLYGDSYNQVWINTNGNLSFTGSISTYSSSGFPYDTPLIAPFWADVDTRSGGQIYYKLNATNLIVTWDRVHHYRHNYDFLTNSFQVIIGTNNDPLTGAGYNISFYYGDMQWTTGSASSGVAGFGGTPATVGVNKGDDIHSYQLGRFDKDNSDYDGPDGNHDGVNYLDYKCINGNVSTDFIILGNEHLPPVAVAQNVTVYLDSEGTVTTTAAQVDCGSTADLGIKSLELSQTDFTCADIGNNNVTLTVTDNLDKTANATAIVTVVDNIPPTAITKNQIVYLDGNGKASITAAMIDNRSYDNCGIYSITLSKTHFDCSNIGTNTVTLTVRDISGNIGTKTATVSVIDNTAPTLILVNNPIVLQRIDGHHVKFDIRELVAQANDNADACNGNLTWSIVKACSDEPEDAQGREDGSTINDIIITDDGQEIELRAESNSLGNGRVYTIYIDAIDASGNRITKTLQVTANSRGRYAAVNDGPIYWAFPGGQPANEPPPTILKTAITQNSPNPFKSTTEISFSLEQDEFANLAIYNMAGELIKTLVSEVKQAGIHTIIWKADDNDGQSAPPGMYIYILKTRDQYLTKKMLLLK